MYGPEYSNPFDKNKKREAFFSQRSSFGPNPNNYKNVIQTQRNNVSVSLETNEILNTQTQSNLAAKGIGIFALRGISFGALGTKDFSEKNLSKFEKEAYKISALHAINEKKDINSKVYKERLNLRSELNKATKENNLEKVADINNKLKETKYEKGFIKYESYQVTGNESITREMKLFTGKATSEAVNIGGKEAVRVTDVYNFERKGYNPILSFLAEVETQQEQGFSGTRIAIGGLSWLANLADKYSGGASSYNVDIIIAKDGTELDEEELKKYREENPYGEGGVTFQDRLIGIGRLAQDASGLAVAGYAGYAMKKQGFAKNVSKLGKAGILAGAFLAPLLAGAVYESNFTDFDNSINVINYNPEAISKFGNNLQENTSNIISAATNFIPNAFSSISNTTSNSLDSLENLLKRASRVPGEANNFFQKRGLDEHQASLAARTVLIGTALGTAAVGGAAIYQGIKVTNNLINKSNVEQVAKASQAATHIKGKNRLLIGAAVLAAGIVGALVAPGKAEGATLPEHLKTQKVSPNKIHAIDADTIEFRDPKKKGSYRLYGADAPETSVYDKYGEDGAKTAAERSEAKRQYLKHQVGEKPGSVTAFITQDFSLEAKKATKQFISNSEYINIVDKGKDAYGRTLSSIENDQGELLSNYLVEKGLAVTELPTSKYFDGSLESYQRYESMVRAYENKQGIFSKDDFVNPTDFRKNNMKGWKKTLDTQIKLDKYKERGLANNEYAYILADEDTYFTLPASLGASAHYGASLESNLMKQAGYNNLSNTRPYKGLAESLMEYNNYMLGNKPLSSFERFVAQSYDTGLHTGGLGNWLNNNVFIPKGWGRVYKDEKGALPSIAGIAGKILDESYLYYANVKPDWMLLGQDYKSGLGLKAKEDNSGMFQTIFEDTTAFGLSMAQSLAMYVAITQPMEMIGAQISKSFIDRSIEGTIIANTSNTIHPLPKQRNFADMFMAKFYFGDMSSSASKAGGMTAAVIEQRIYNDLNKESATLFFDHEQGPASMFKIQMMISRGRARTMLEGTFKPFLQDIVNPFNPSSKIQKELSSGGVGNYYDEFNVRVARLIDIIASPVDLTINFKTGKTVEFQAVEAVMSDIRQDISLAEAKAKKGGVVINISSNKKLITNFSDLSKEYSASASKLNKQLVETNEELYKILTQDAGMSDISAKIFIIGQGDKSKILKEIPETQRLRVGVLLQRQTQLGVAKDHIKTQLGSYADKIEVATTNTGINYKTNIASALQDILELMPLNPLKWGLFNGSAENADEFIQVGQAFSFRDAAQYTERVLTGQTQLSALFKQFEPVVPDPFQDGVRLGQVEQLSNKVKARVVSFDRILGAIHKNIKSLWSPEPKTGPNIRKLTNDLRQVEITVAEAARKAEVDGFKFTAVTDSVNHARSSRDVLVANVDKAVDLLDSVIEYSHSVRSNGAKVIDLVDMSKAIESAAIKDVTSELIEQSRIGKVNKGINKALGESKGYIALAVFAGLALNNMMQSTKGASIITQLGMAIYGENEDIAIKYEANRFLPTEMLAQALGLSSSTGVNLVADAVFIGGAYAVGHHIGNQMTTSGYLPYTFDEETIYKIAQNEHVTITDRLGNIIDPSKIKPSPDSFIYINKKVALPDGGYIVKQTVLTRNINGFKSEKILQEFAEHVPTKALIFGSIALLATNALREGAATMLAAMSESPDDKSYLGIMAGLSGGGFVIGSYLDGTYIAKTAESGSAVVKAGGQVASQVNLKQAFRTKGARWAVGGAIVGATIWAAKLALDPNIKQKGSLDPLIAGVGLGIGVGVFKHSAGLGLAAGLVAMSAMAALNWAGIRFLELGRGGKEIDPENAKLVAQLSQFSTAVLEGEKDNTAFMVGMAAYASQFSAGKSIISKDGGTATDETQVIAKQSPLPILQFFVAEKIEGKRGEIYGRVTPDGEATVRKYTLGIQTGALLGTSLSVELPVSYTPGEGFFGFTYNADNNLGAVPNFVVNVGVWAAAATSTVGLMYNAGAWMSSQAYNLTGAHMFKAGAADFNKAAGELFSTSRFILNSAEKITSAFIRTTVGIFTTLQGTDASMAYNLYMNSGGSAEQAAATIQNNSIKNLTLTSTEEQAKLLNSLDDVSGAKLQWDDIKTGQAIKYAGRSKHLLFGALLGAVIGGTVSDVVKHFKLKSSHEADASFEDLQKVEAQEERRKMIYVAIGGSAGAILNDVRSSTGSLIRSLNRNHRSAVTEILKAKGVPLEAMQESISRVTSKFGSNTHINKFKSNVLNNKILKTTLKYSKALGRHKMLGVFIAATAYSFVKTSSEFGIASMMDRHIVYDEKGNAYKDYEQQTAPNLVHHLGTAAILGGIYYTPIIGLAASPHINQRATMLEFANRELAATHGVKTKGVLSKVRSKATDILFSVHRFRTEKESIGLLKSLLNVDNEFAEYEEYLEGKATNPELKLPQKLQKLEDVLKLRHALGKEEIKEFITLRNQYNKGIPFDTEQATNYNKFLNTMSTQLSQEENYKSLAKGFKVTSNLTSFAKRAGAIFVVLAITKFAITTVMNQGGEVGKDSYLDRIYNKANQVGKFGQRRQDGSVVGLEGFISMGADALRMITERDIANLSYAVDSLNGKMVKSTGQRLLANAETVVQAQKNVKDLSQMLVIDNPNAYLATLEFGGKTLRQGDKGVTTSSYFQLQGPAQDISTATYSMAAKFIFSEYTSGRGKLGSVIDKGMATYNAKDPETWIQTAVNIRNASSMMDAMKDSRQFSKVNSDVAAALAGDSLASMILALRQEALVHIAWQPVDSLFTNMFFETIDKAKTRTSEKNLVKFLEGIARSDINILDVFANLMEGGIFENFFSRTAITNVIFFTGSAGKPPKQGNAQFMATNMSDLWHQGHDLSVQAEMFQQSRVEFVDQFMDKVAIPLSSHSIFAIMPNWMKIGGLATVTLGLSAVLTNMLANLTETKTFNQSVGDLLDVFGKTNDVVSLSMHPNDVTKVVKELSKNIANGQNYQWDVKPQGSLSVAVGKGATENKFIGLMNIGSKDAGNRFVRFELNAVIDKMDEGKLQQVTTLLNTKGDQLRNLFAYTEETLDETGKVIKQARKAISTALLETAEIHKWLQTTSEQLQGTSKMSVYDIFSAKETTVTKFAFITKATENFHSKFDQGLSKLFDIGNLDNVNNHLFQIVNVDGTEYLMGELLDPEGEADIQGKTIEQRRTDLEAKYKGWRDKFNLEIQTIVKEEYGKIQFNGKSASLAEETAQIADANRRVLLAIKTKMADPNTVIGGVSRGAGIVQATDMLDQKAMANGDTEIPKGKQKSKYKITVNKAAPGGPMQTFTDELGDTLHYTRPLGNVGFWDSLAAGGKGLMTAGFTIFDVLTGADMLGAYLRSAEVLNSPFATDLDKQMAQKELGRAILSSAVGLGIGHLSGKLLGAMGSEPVKKFLTSPKNLGKGVVGLVAGTIIGTATWKSLISPGINKLTGAAKDNNILGKSKQAFDKVWWATGDIVGTIASAPVIGAYNFGKVFGVEKEASYFTAGFLGGALTAGTILFGVASILATSISLPVIAAITLGAGLIIGVSSLFAGKQMSSGLTYATREIAKIPVVGPMANMTDPYRAIRNQERFRHHFTDSPFLLGYVGDLVNSNWLQMLSAAENPGGRDTVALLFGEILSTDDGGAVNISAWKLHAADSMIGAPKPITDEVIMNELKHRAEAYSDVTIGRYTWDQLVENSDNSNAIRSIEAMNRAERIKSTEHARNQAMKVAMDAGGARAALRLNNPRKTALTQMQQARVEEIYKDLDTYGKPQTLVTAATLSTHKSNAANSDLDLGDKAKARSLSQNGVANVTITKKYAYKGSVVYDNKTASVNIKKEADQLNPVLLAQAQAMGANNPISPDQTSQTKSYNAHKNQK